MCIYREIDSLTGTGGMRAAAFGWGTIYDYLIIAILSQ